MNTLIIVHESSQVAEARRAAVNLARRLALDSPAVDRLGLAVTEAATNLVKHARQGSILLAPLTDNEAVGIEVIALDRGPGMANVVASMRDGHSTAGSPGLGLGSMSRLASNLDVYSEQAMGTVLRFEMWKHDRRPALRNVTAGGVCVAMAGEEVSGDAWSSQNHDGTHRLLVVDGLGHGPDAAMAANTALRVAREQSALDPAALLACLHDALRSTRGAAASVASMVPRTGTGVYAGIGNIRGFARGPAGVRNLVSHNGTLGQQVRKIQAFDFAFPPRTLLVMHSDGIASHWNLDGYRGIERHHPAVVAATVFRDHARGRDDATVAVLRNDVESS
jgi:anti-sigma regulatory factor (Ser/Thr protein kinase)